LIGMRSNFKLANQALELIQSFRSEQTYRNTPTQSERYRMVGPRFDWQCLIVCLRLIVFAILRL
jgi:hypothetical protein